MIRQKNVSIELMGLKFPFLDYCNVKATVLVIPVDQYTTWT